jgi:ribose transport system permease protein
MLGVLILMIAVFSVLRPDSFGTFDNLKSIALIEATVVILALAALVPRIVDEFDFSIGAIFALSQTMCVGLVVQHHWSIPIALLVALSIGATAGLVNGVMVAKVGLGSFVATLATSGIYSGLTLLYTNGEAVFGSAPKAFTNISRSEPLGIPLPIIYALVIAVFLSVAFSSFPVGRRLYAMGSNRKAAHLMGIRDQRYVIGTFIMSGLLASVGGIILGAEVGSATSESGLALLIPAFSGVFLGATAITPGRFNVWGTVIAVYLVAVMVTGLQQLGAKLWVTPVFQGAVLLAAVSLSLWTSKIRASRARAARIAALDRQAEAGQSNIDVGEPTAGAA